MACHVPSDSQSIPSCAQAAPLAGSADGHPLGLVDASTPIKLESIGSVELSFAVGRRSRRRRRRS